MKFVSEYRDPHLTQPLIDAIAALSDRPCTLMEICGGQTHAILKYGIDRLLPDTIELIHGPGCPVCVTPVEAIDQAIELAATPGIIFCSFGDMLRVPGSRQDLLTVKARGGDVRPVYSPLDAVTLAQNHPEREVVFFAVGFETTAPAVAMAAVQARKLNLRNFSLLVSHVRVPPAMSALLNAEYNRVEGFLAAGHVCTVMGYTEYEKLAETFKVPIVVTGFEPTDVLAGIYHCVKQLHEGRHCVENAYSRSVRREGNPTARKLLEDVFEIVDRDWRGLGLLPDSGLGLSSAYRDFDAAQRFELAATPDDAPNECLSGKILTGQIKPDQCPAFGTRCTPEHPLGATMVSSEGACAAYYRYR